MENEIINYLAKDIVEKFKKYLNFKSDMDIFLNSTISIPSKEKSMELLYLCQLYSNAYIGPDPRAKFHFIMTVHSVLVSKNEDELNNNLENLKKVIEIFKNSETNPLATAKRKIEDEKKYSGVIF